MMNLNLGDYVEVYAGLALKGFIFLLLLPILIVLFPFVLLGMIASLSGFDLDELL